MRKQLTRAILITGTVVAAFGLGVAPAFAVNTATVSGGPSFTSSQSSGTTFTLTNNGNSFKCTVGSGAGSVVDGTHVIPGSVGTVTSDSFGSPGTPCTGPFGSSGSSAEKPCGGTGQRTCPALNVSSVSGTTATGTITSIDNVLTVHNLIGSPNPCTIEVTGTAGVTYNSSTHLLVFTTANDNLSISSSGTTCNGASGTATFSSGTGGETVTGSPTNPITISSP